MNHRTSQAHPTRLRLTLLAYTQYPSPRSPSSTHAPPAKHHIVITRRALVDRRSHAYKSYLD